MSGVMRLENQGSMAHLPDPGIRQSGSLKESSCPFNAGEACGYPVGNREFGSESLCHFKPMQSVMLT
jgi:hypothetical protein